MDVIRIGNVSAVDRSTGMVSVVYQDQDGGTTGFLPYFSCGDEFKPPAVDDMVLVAHLSNGATRGIVIGRFWNKSNVPPDSEADWYKKLSDIAFMKYVSESDTIHIKASNVVFELDGKIVDLKDLAGG
jgi:phage baseplate assembly protein gpV